MQIRLRRFCLEKIQKQIKNTYNCILHIQIYLPCAKIMEQGSIFSAFLCCNCSALHAN